MKRLLPCFLALALLFPGLPLHAAPNGSLIKSASDSAVYYLVDGKRYAFPNEKVFFSWYANFNGVITVSATELAGYTLAGNATYRPGKWLVKIQTDPKVYAVSRYGVLHWVTSEQLASALYGTNWNAKVHDVPDAFFTNYELGTAISSSSDYDLYYELAATVIAQNIRGATVPSPIPPTNGIANISGCQVFPADNAWSRDISQLPVHPKSADYINTIGTARTLHPDFGENQDYGIPFNVVPVTQPKGEITFTAYGDESDPGPYPIPTDAKIEGGSDRHVLVLENETCTLYELFNARKNPNNSGWYADSGAIWHLDSNDLRPYGWTSADAAGLPILPGLVRYDEVAAGEIKHAIRFTASRTQNGYILPATHHAGTNNTSYPPMGLRVRLKADYDISGLSGQALVIAKALKKYGFMLADNGSNWYFQGATDPRWNDDELNQLKDIPGSAFEAVDTGTIMQ
ncbi:hypothetical protein M0Q28_02930 [Patescibacteria group bacterium]|jgi:hypothetical protein|nr:hypothetical protein [Patescibacteria group bacterium]